MNTRQYRLGLAAIVVPTAAGIGGIAAAIVMSTSSGTSTPPQPVQVVANVTTSAPAPSVSAPVKPVPKPVVVKPSTSVYVPPATSQAPVQRQQVAPADETPPVDPTTTVAPATPAPAVPIQILTSGETRPGYSCGPGVGGGWQCVLTASPSP
jgi:hypothetical protein